MEYRTSVYLGIIDGKKVRKTVRATSQRELDRKVRKLKSEVDEGKDCYTKATFEVWADKWLNEVKIPSGICSGTITQIKCALKYLNDEFGDMEFKNITLSDFQRFINELARKNPNTQKPTAKRTLESVKTVAMGVFDYARSNNISGVPEFFRSVVLPKTAPKTKRRALSEEEQQWIIDTPHRAQLPAMLMMFAGLRRGELIPLQWEDIDFDNNIITVNRFVEFGANRSELKDIGKSENAERIVPLPPILKSYLEQRKGTGLVCPNLKNEMHSKTSWRRLWDSYLVELNIKYGWDNKKNKYDPKGVPMLIPNITPHFLRHTYATILYLQDVDVVTAKQLLGHSDIQTTINIYTDLKNFNRFTLSEEYKRKLSSDFNIKKGYADGYAKRQKTS